MNIRPFFLFGLICIFIGTGIMLQSANSVSNFTGVLFTTFGAVVSLIQLFYATPFTKSKSSVQPLTPSQNTPTNISQLTRSKNTSQQTRGKDSWRIQYLLGLLILLVNADFLRLYEQRFLVYIGVEKLIFKLNIFGGVIYFNTSTIIFLITFIAIVCILIYFRLLPGRSIP